MTQLPRVPSSREWGDGRGGYGQTSPDHIIEQVATLVSRHPTLALTGAGMSTGSGLSDYRGQTSRPRNPMTFTQFATSDAARQRYWARSCVGWTAFQRARPNADHILLAELGTHSGLTGVVTQNVDGFHSAAGSAPVVDLHGRLDRIICLSCGTRSGHDALQQELLRLNPDIAARLDELSARAEWAPDGDAEIEDLGVFGYPDCPVCGGILKPDVVFFGENAHPEVVAEANALLDGSEALLVLGSTLTVMSGLRFVRQAAHHSKPVIIVNDGNTRGDALATIRVHGRLRDVLTRIRSLVG
ncbi:MAG: Sir2 family NAD-dependent protein deacetylase [Arachnia sp.]